jgi:hypothetical protein
MTPRHSHICINRPYNHLGVTLRASTLPTIEMINECKASRQEGALKEESELRSDPSESAQQTALKISRLTVD